jgi:hypothetical protein
MRVIALLLPGILLAGAAIAGDVYVTKDEKGVPVYTDTPRTIPAEKLGIKSTSTDKAAVQTQYQERMKQYAADDAAASQKSSAIADASKAAALTAEDKAKRCAEARGRYAVATGNDRLYEIGPNGERRYLSSEEIDAARTGAKRVMDEFCGGQ